MKSVGFRATPFTLFPFRPLPVGTALPPRPMPRPIVKFIALLLLLAQAVVGVAPGRVVCFSLGDCEGGHGCPRSCDHAEHCDHSVLQESRGCDGESDCSLATSNAAPCSTARTCDDGCPNDAGEEGRCEASNDRHGLCSGGCSDSTRSLIAVALHLATDCGSECCCRLHVPLRGEPQVPSRTVSAHAAADASPAPRPPSVMTLMPDGAPRSNEAWRIALRGAPDFDTSAQVLALEATRLLI